MKIAFDRLLSDGLDLEIPNEGKDPDRLKLAKGTNVRGAYIQNRDEILLSEMSAEEMDAALVSWGLGDGDKVAAAPLTLKGLELDAKIARGILQGRQRFAGRIAVREVAAKSLLVALGEHAVRSSGLAVTNVEWSSSKADGMVTRVGHAQLTTLAVKTGETRIELAAADLGAASVHTAAGATTIDLGTLEARGARVGVGTTIITFESVTAKGVKVKTGAGGLSLSLSSLAARAVEITAGTTKLHIDRVELKTGLTYQHGHVHIPHGSIGEVGVALSGLQPKGGAKASDAPPAVTDRLDFSFLDGLDGNVAIDVMVDAKVPVIKRRVATHKLRVAIQDGIIDFKELEHNLSLLEDAILDFEFEGDRLILEKDLPLIPFDNETLVYWQLNDDGKALASKRHVRLSTLVHPQIPKKPEEPSDKPKKSSFELQRLDLDPIDATLRLLGPSRFVLANGAALRFGAQDRPAIGELRVTGALRHRIDNAQEPGQIEAELKELSVGLRSVQIGDRILAADDISITSVTEARVQMAGFQPTDVRAIVRGIELTNVALVGSD